MQREPRFASTFIFSAIGFTTLLLAACNEDSPLLPSATGGFVAVSGGATGASSGGSTATSQGGNTGQATGGAANAATGGASTGGSSPNATGGSATGGTAANGGSVATGGATTTATGGAKATGGSNATGGASAATGGGSGTACPTAVEETFSFFLLSQAALQKDSGQTDGYGGDLGGITGADAICQRVAEKSSPCQKNKTWHAFLSTSTVNAKDRIGRGPWYDRVGRLLATNMTNLLTERPTGADVAIINDLPNEDGVPNHAPNGTLEDNHQILTGTGTDGNAYKQTTSVAFPGGETSCGPQNQETWSVDAATCWGWTTKAAKGCPRAGHSWPRVGSGINWISVWNEGGCAPGGNLADTGGLDGTRRVGSAGGYGGFYCFAVTGN